MDEFTSKHLQAWADDALHEDEREEVVKAITAFVESDLDVLGCGYDWAEIRAIIERNEKLGISV